MALNLKNPEVEALAAEVAHLARESKTEAIRQSLIERKARLQVSATHRPSQARLIDFLERSVWPNVAPGALGRRISRDEEDAILDYGPEGF
jgi:antitoxin VapB